MNSIPVKALFFSLCCVNLSYGAVFLESEALFIRTTGQPQEETVTFPVYNPTIPYIIKVQNGPDGYDRISSASVSFLLNDQEIFTSSDFNQQVEWLETPITVTTENTLRVLLTSKPGGALKIWIFGSDDYSPSISITAPADQSILTTIQPTITCVFSDVESGCVPDSFRILLNGADHTDLFTIDQTSASAAITDPVSFPEGTFTIWASIADRGGNRDTASIQCTIDISTPLLSIDTPEDGVPINNPQPTVTITYSDAVSGININTLSITLNGIDKTPFFTIDATHATWEVGPEHALGEGVYQLEATIADHGGNAAAANSGFEIDLTPPEVAITGPADGYITNISELTIIWTIDGVEQSEQTSVTLVEGANT
ncbi:MAG: hypothetical protein JXA18_10185, partial [Chitinispirillaceae bacterium]|nr:hypothetical protein [Chitinispirillaceae bacterium]